MINKREYHSTEETKRIDFMDKINKAINEIDKRFKTYGRGPELKEANNEYYVLLLECFRYDILSEDDLRWFDRRYTRLYEKIEGINKKRIYYKNENTNIK